ncbi:MAG: DUF2786 domain-containing protein [Alishewanella aestuarii]
MSDKRIERIKKLLALAKSSNEHEAANALRLAQKLMKELERVDLCCSLFNQPTLVATSC